MELRSSAFKEGEDIPLLYTCKGKNLSPPLEIKTPPEGTCSFVLIVEDPDVPAYIRSDGMWDHWVVFNIPSQTRQIPEGVSFLGISGKNTEGTLGYQGPCPPDRKHRYFFKLYALDTLLSLQEGCSKREVESALQGHIVAQAQLMGRFDKCS
jgi:Raf kinase inhibitor-like YbhB/YbcL family protein